MSKWQRVVNGDQVEYVHEDGKAFIFKHGVRDYEIYPVGGSAKAQGIKVPGGYFKTKKAAIEAFDKENHA